MSYSVPDNYNSHTQRGPTRCLGVLSEYIGHIYDEVRRRPLHSVDRAVRGDEANIADTAARCAKTMHNAERAFNKLADLHRTV